MATHRFFGGAMRGPELSAFERRAQIMAQTPYALVLGCSDSRVPVEIVFDQGLGDLFIVRVAGQIADPSTLGSIEYAITHLKVHLVMVMGHEGCGAVKAALLPDAQIARESEHVRYLIEQIRPAVVDLPCIRDEKARMREAVTSHVRYSPGSPPELTRWCRPVVATGQIAVIGAYYEIGSGAVDFFVTEQGSGARGRRPDLRATIVRGRLLMADQARAAAGAAARAARSPARALPAAARHPWSRRWAWCGRAG
ncbi:MAG: carbonic anhydrase [Kouleothrix sp.]